MASIEVKFAFGQEVWFYRDGGPAWGHVSAVTCSPDLVVYRVKWGRETFISVDESILFASASELASVLSEQAKKLIEVI